MDSDMEKLDRYTLFIDEDDNIDSEEELLSSKSNKYSLKRPLQDPHPAATRNVRKYQGIKQSRVLEKGSAPPPRPPPPPIPLAIKPQNQQKLVPVLPGSPWEYYERKWEQELAGKVAVVIAVKTKYGEKGRLARTTESEMPEKKHQFLLRSLSGRGSEEKLLNIRQHQEENLVTTYEIFDDEGVFYLISEFMCLSLLQICRCPKYPDERQLLAMVAQFLNGICFLTLHKLQHNALTPSNILMDAEGSLKIANLENCSIDKDRGQKNAESLGRTMTLLMDKHARKDVIGFDNSGRWSELAQEFLSMTTSLTPNALKDHAFIKSDWCKEDLIWLVSYARVKAETR